MVFLAVFVKKKNMLAPELFLVLSTPAVLDNRAINECGAVGGMRLVRETEVLGENLPQCNIAHRESHMT
jgi:hypothetical protein